MLESDGCVEGGEGCSRFQLHSGGEALDVYMLSYSFIDHRYCAMFDGQKVEW